MQTVQLWQPGDIPLGVDTSRWRKLMLTVPVRPDEVAYNKWYAWRSGRQAPTLNALEYTLRVLCIDERVALDALGWSAVPVSSIRDVVAWILQARLTLVEKTTSAKPRRSSYDAVKRHRARQAIALQRTFLGLSLPRTASGKVDLRQISCPTKRDPNAGIRPDIIGFQDQEERDAALTAAHYKSLEQANTEPDTDTTEHENQDDQP